MVFADGRMVERVDQLESEVAQLQDAVEEMKHLLETVNRRLEVLETDPALEVIRHSVMEEQQQ
jgi:TolA-binding protein